MVHRLQVAKHGTAYLTLELPHYLFINSMTQRSAEEHDRKYVLVAFIQIELL